MSEESIPGGAAPEGEDIGRPGDGGCGDAALYLLGLLDEERAAAFVEHARGCAVCGDELAALGPAVDALPAMVPAVAAPEGVRRQVMEVVRAEARAGGEAAGGEIGKDAVGNEIGGEAAGGIGREAAGGEVRGEGHRDGFRRGVRARARARTPRIRSTLGIRATRKTLGIRALPAGAALLAAVAVGVGVGALVSGGGAPATRVVAARVAPAGVRAAVHRSGSRAWLTVAGLSQPRAGDVYEVWLKRPGGPPLATSSLFSPTAAGAGTVAIPGDVSGVQEVLVTEEPAGGSRLPTSSPLIVVRVT
ncbi:MAG TPA: anti-sigma factor [Solirubrobacteraceae bacterium]|nr:anti-sigma factor [Solirubrobacteraceae bacterium]